MSQQSRWNARNPEVIRAAMKRLEARNLKIVEAELEARGGHCIYEGCTETRIEWHHRDPATKTKSIGSSIRLHSEARLRAELALCDPLCRRHHMIVDGRLEGASNYWRINKMPPRTSRKPDSKLTEEQVREIRSRRASGERTTALARAYGVSQSSISMIANRKHWAWLSD